MCGAGAEGGGGDDEGVSIMSNVENVCPQVLRSVSRELRRLAASPPAGIKLVLRDDDLTDVVAHMEGPGNASQPSTNAVTIQV